MNHAGRDRAAGPPGAPACRGDHGDRGGPCRLSRQPGGDRRREGGDLARAGAGRHRGAAGRQPDLPRAARSRGRRPRRDVRRRARCRRAAARRECRMPTAATRSPLSIGEGVRFRLAAPGPAHGDERAGGAGRRRGAGRWMPAQAAQALAGFAPWPGAARGAHDRGAGRRARCCSTRATTPTAASVRAALAVLRAAAGDAADRRAGRHAGTGRSKARPNMPAWPRTICRRCRSAVRLRPADARACIDAVPAALRGAHAADSAALAPIVAGAVRPGDAVLVKGSLGSRMKLVVAALDAPACRQERLMLYQSCRARSPAISSCSTCSATSPSGPARPA